MGCGYLSDRRCARAEEVEADDPRCSRPCENARMEVSDGPHHTHRWDMIDSNLEQLALQMSSKGVLLCTKLKN
jgi:hypothetical protein